MENIDTRIVEIPTERSEWNIDILNKLVEIQKIETDDLDFKSDYKDLSKHLCAFANYSFGQMILGIESQKTEDGRTIGIKKQGFLKNESDSIRNEVNNAMFNVDPTPSVELIFIGEGERVFPVVQITGEDSRKPYFQRSSGICYVRIGASTAPASRTNVINLFSDIRSKIENLEKLAISADFLKEMIMYTCEKLTENNPRSVFSRITPLNPDLFKNCALSTEWFLKDKNLYGGHIREDSAREGLHSFIYDIELFNLDIIIYNSELAKNRKTVKERIDNSWRPGGPKYRLSTGFLDEIIKQARTFIESKQLRSS
jgi:hypothetical protein